MRGDSERFHNEPGIDFSWVENRQRFAATLQQVRGELAKTRRTSGGWLESVNPAAPDEIVGRVRRATIAEAEKAIDKAARFFPEWRATPVADRAEILLKAAEIMRQRRWQLAAMEFSKSAKVGAKRMPMFARRSIISITMRMRCYGSPRRARPSSLPSETNHYFYEPRGLAVVIAPWNFPLAILTGMTAAALVTGNCVLMKPAEQAPVMGAQLLDILQSAGLPDGACQLLQGGGEHRRPFGAIAEDSFDRLHRFAPSRLGNPPRSLHTSPWADSCKAGGLRDGRQECRDCRRRCRS